MKKAPLLLLLLFPVFLQAQLSDNFTFTEEQEDRVTLPDVKTLFDPAPIVQIHSEIWNDMRNQNPEIYFNYPIRTELSQRVTEEIDNAETEILINTYAITDINIAQALLRAHALRNVLVILILEPRPSIRNYRTPTFFIENSILTFYSQDEGINNNSYIVIDKKSVITGSLHFTQTAHNLNAENLMIFKDMPNIATPFYLNFLLHLSFSEIPELQLLKTPDIREDLLNLLELR